MAYAKRGKRSYKKRRNYRRSYRRRTSRFAKTVKRIATRAVSRSLETKKVNVFTPNVELQAPFGAVYTRELTTEIVQGVEGGRRIGREVTLNRVRFKHIVKGEDGFGPIYIRWCVMEHIGKDVINDTPFRGPYDQEKKMYNMAGAEAIFSQVNTEKWRYLMGDSYKLLPDNVRGDQFDRNSGGTMLLMKHAVKSMKKRLHYPVVPRQANAAGEDFWAPVQADRPIYLFAFARCLDNQQTATEVAAKLHYHLTLYFKDA